MAIQDLEWSADALDRLSELHEARELIDFMIDETVTECRTKGIAQEPHTDDVTDSAGTTTSREVMTFKPASWRQIAEALKMSRQSAWQKYRWNE